MEGFWKSYRFEGNLEAAFQGRSYEKVFWKYLADLQENTDV